MIDEPMVSIVTPTIVGREDELISRCVPSVAKLHWGGRIEHVIVSDRNPELRARLARRFNHPMAPFDRVRFVEINESWRTPMAEASVGAVPFATGALLALGEFVGYCGDDDELLPDHVERHVARMREVSAMFSISAVDFRVDGEHRQVIGPGLAHGQLDAIGIMHHVDALRHATWTANGENAADWRLVRDWVEAGLIGVLVDGPPTAIHHDGWMAGKTGRPDRPGGWGG